MSNLETRIDEVSKILRSDLNAKIEHNKGLLDKTLDYVMDSIQNRATELTQQDGASEESSLGEMLRSLYIPDAELALYHEHDRSRKQVSQILERDLKAKIEHNKGIPELIAETEAKDAEKAVCALKYAGAKSQDNKEVVLRAVTLNAYDLRYASERLRDDRDVVLAAVQQDGFALEYASYRLCDDEDVVLAAACSNMAALVYASEELKSDDVRIRKLIKKRRKEIRRAKRAASIRKYRKRKLSEISDKIKNFFQRIYLQFKRD